jgi:Bifunctional DNA primase/polymerase, N-terminal
MTGPARLGPGSLAARVLGVLADGTGYPDDQLANILGIAPAELSPVIGMLYRRGLADRCEGYIVASASVPRRNGTSGTSGTRARQDPDPGFRTAPGVPEPPEPSPLARQEEPMPADPSRAALLEAALSCAARGWHIFPLRPGDKRPAFPDHKAADCTGTDARCRGGHQGWEPRATTDPARIRRAWAQAPYNIGIATGPSGLVVIDLDTSKPGEAPPPPWAQPGITDGADVLAALCEQRGQPFPCETFMVRTRRGGLHLYFTAPTGARFGNTSGRLGWLVDTRGHGGYAVGPGSFADLPDGAGRYELAYDRPPVPLPGWLAALLSTASREPPSVGCSRRMPGTVADLPSYADAALGGEITRVLTSPDHGHNWALNKAAFNLGRRIAAGVLDRELAERALQAAGEVTQASETTDRIAAVIRAGIDAGIRRAAA